MKELFGLHPSELTLHLSEVFNRIIEKALDTSNSVRKALHGLLSFIFQQLQKEIFSPFIPLFVIYITSAMTHAQAGIQIDAINIIDLCLQYFPDLIILRHKQVHSPLPNLYMFSRVPVTPSIPQDYLGHWPSCFTSRYIFCAFHTTWPWISEKRTDNDKFVVVSSTSD